MRRCGYAQDGKVYTNNIAILTADHDGKIALAPVWFEVRCLEGAAWPLPRL